VTIIKVKELRPADYFDEGNPGELYLGCARLNEPDPFPPFKKITISYKSGKRRKLIKGTIEVRGIDCRHIGYYDNFFFIPLNAHQKEKLRLALCK
jgi:hypothetical protein